MRSIRARYLAGSVLPDVARRPLPIPAPDPTWPGEHPPVRFDCPLHVGELLPCRICASRLRRPQAAE